MGRWGTDAARRRCRPRPRRPRLERLRLVRRVQHQLAGVRARLELGEPLELRAVVAVEAHHLARGEHAPEVGLRVVAQPGEQPVGARVADRARCRSRAARSSRRRRRRRRAPAGGCRCPCGTRRPRGPRGRTRPSRASGSGRWRRAPSPGRSARPPGARLALMRSASRGPRARASLRVSRSLAPPRPPSCRAGSAPVSARICVSPTAPSRSSLARASGRPALSSSTMPSIRSGSTPASSAACSMSSRKALHAARRGDDAARALRVHHVAVAGRGARLELVLAARCSYAHGSSSISSGL